MRKALGLCVVGLLAVGCGEGKGPTAQNGPQSGGDTTIRIVTEVDAATANGEDSGVGRELDAGADSGIPAYSCERVEALLSSTEDTPNLTSTDLPDDFVVTRQAVSWGADCTTPLLTLEFSDGACPHGNGHQLELDLSATALLSGVIHLGNNDVSADNANIVARYTRPNRLKPYGTWGTCGAASGTLIFLDPPGNLSKGQFLQARYQLLLAPCDDSKNSPIEVDGAFKVELRYDFASICPVSAP
jgi:hypothetical protein